MNINDPEGFYTFTESLLLDMVKMGGLIPRVDPQLVEERENYSVYRSTVIRYPLSSRTYFLITFDYFQTFEW